MNVYGRLVSLRETTTLKCINRKHKIGLCCADLALSTSFSAPRHLSSKERRSSEAASTLASNSRRSLRAASNWRFCSESWLSVEAPLCLASSKSWLTSTSFLFSSSRSLRRDCSRLSRSLNCCTYTETQREEQT